MKEVLKQMVEETISARVIMEIFEDDGPEQAIKEIANIAKKDERFNNMTEEELMLLSDEVLSDIMWENSIERLLEELIEENINLETLKETFDNQDTEKIIKLVKNLIRENTSTKYKPLKDLLEEKVLEEMIKNVIYDLWFEYFYFEYLYEEEKE